MSTERPAVTVADFEWKRSLFLLWIAQVLSIVGFGFGLPFVPFYVQELGITDPARLKIWYGLFVSSTGVPLAIATPVWGILADRIGRKPMALRASLGGAVILFGMGLARSPGTLLILRVFQGFLTGTVTAYLILVVTKTPPDKTGFSIGIMNSAIFVGNTLGPLLGGMYADRFGYRSGFFISSGLLLSSFLITLLLVKEDFKKPVEKTSLRSLVRDTRIFFVNRRILGIFILIFVFAVTRTFIKPVYPLLIQELMSGKGALATNTGIVNAVRGLATVLAGITVGYLIDRKKNLPLGFIIALFAAVSYVPFVFVGSVFQMSVLVLFTGFFSGGINPMLNIYLSKRVANERKGAAFGIAGSFKSIGWAIGGMSGGFIAAAFGLRSLFILCAAFFVFIALALGRLEKANSGERKEKIG